MQTTGRERTVSILALVALQLLLLALVGRIVYLQIVYRPRLLDRTARQQTGTRPLLARRGTIRDCRSRILAGTTIRPSAFVDPAIVTEPELLAQLGGQILQMDPDQILKKIQANPGKRFLWLKRRLTDSQAQKIRSLPTRGLGIIEEAVRQYPMASLAAHLLGYVGADRTGLDGLELKYDSILRGSDGWEQFVEDAAGRPIWLVRNGYKVPQDGQHLILTIDAAIQEFTAQALAQACQKFQAPSGMAIVMDPRTGEILAMANWPTFDPADFAKCSADLRRNRTVTDPFEPGSVFKPFIAAQALASGVVQWDETIFCYNGAYTTGRRVLHDHHPYGDLTFQQIVIHSSNIGMGILGQRLGNSRIYQTVRRFGFGSKLGVELPGESPGIVLPLRKWTDYSTTSLPMGQEIATTALQLISAFCALANDGLLCRPKIIRGIIDNTGQVIQDFTEPEIISKVLEPEVARAMVRSVLRAAVSQGTGQRADIPGMEVFGKTGTAQISKPGGGGYMHRQYVASFIGGAPASDPQIVVLVTVRQPDPKIAYYGGTVAAPAVKQILASTLDYLGIRKTTPQPRSYNSSN